MPNLAKSKELREKRANLVEQNRKVRDQIKQADNQARIDELETEWIKRDDEIEQLAKQIEREERQERLDEEMQKPAQERRSGRGIPGQMTDEQRLELRERYKRAFWTEMRYGMHALEPDDQILLRQGWRQMESGPVINLGAEQRAMSTTVAAGGYTIPQGFFAELQQNMLAFGGVRSVARVITTDSGNALPIPTVDDTSQEAQIIGEGSALTSPQDPTFAVVTLNAFMYRTLCLVSLELLQDSAFDLEAWIRAFIAERVARGTNRHFTTGNGSTQPNGFIPASSSGFTAASATSVAYADLVELEHSVDPAYRALPGTGWQMADGTLKVIKKLVDTEGRPLWVPGVAVREPNTILGYPYTINQHMAAVQASNKSVAFGNWQKYWIRDVGQMLIVRANELHIGSGQIGFYAFSRHDGDIIDAGTDPIKHLTHPSPD